MRRIIYCLLLFLWSCTNIDDAKPDERSTFIYLYESVDSYTGVQAEQIPGGYVILGNQTVDQDSVNTILIKTDNSGRTLVKYVIPGGSGKFLKVVSDGYLILGDSIHFDLNAPVAANISVSSARLVKLTEDNDLNPDNNAVAMLYQKGNKNNSDSTYTDFFGNSIASDDAGNIYLLGTFRRVPSATEKPFIIALDGDLSPLWNKTYESVDRDYVNGKRLFYSGGKLFWASAILQQQQSLANSYISIPVVEDGTIFVNNSLYGATETQRLSANDITTASNPSFGFGLIGSYAATDGNKSNVFFVRINQAGDIMPGSEHFYDGFESRNNDDVAKTSSTNEDTGNAITATKDGGFVLACSMLSTLERGNGLHDVWLIKIDAFGNPIWNKIIGGSGDEVVNSIRETDDGGLLICGTNTVAGLPTIFVLRTDKNGDIKN